jgi:hypothetical protein
MQGIMEGFSARIRPGVERELGAARAARRLGNAATAFSRLERAHVLGQAATLLHVRVHWHMLLWGLRERSAKEALGQALRIAGAAVMTPFGLVPRGNTGGTNVSPFKPMPIPRDLQRLIDAARD